MLEGVEQNQDAGAMFKHVEQLPVARIVGTPHGLYQPIDVGDGEFDAAALRTGKVKS